MSRPKVELHNRDTERASQIITPDRHLLGCVADVADGVARIAASVRWPQNREPYSAGVKAGRSNPLDDRAKASKSSDLPTVPLVPDLVGPSMSVCAPNR
jgi:BRCT domain type II-containing protein